MSSVIELNGGIVKRFFKRYLVIIMLFGVLCGLLASFTSFKLSGTEYQSTGTLIQNDNNYNLISSYQQFAKSDKFSRLVTSKIDQSEWKNKSFKNDYSTSWTSGGTTSPFFFVTVKSKNKEYARYVTTITMQLFIANIGKYLSGANVSIVAKASGTQVAHEKSKLIKIGMLAAVIGWVLATITAIYRLIWSGNIPDSKYVADVYGLNHLGTLETNHEAKTGRKR